MSHLCHPIFSDLLPCIGMTTRPNPPCWVNVMPPTDPRQGPSLRFCELRHSLASHGLHIANSRI